MKRKKGPLNSDFGDSGRRKGKERDIGGENKDRAKKVVG